MPPISIHALLAESDLSNHQSVNYTLISIHALLAESDTPKVFRHCTTYLFLSTLSLRRATYPIIVRLYNDSNFYPRSPCGERPCTTIITICTVSFLSTLSLRRATSTGTMATSAETFLSTLSLRRATAAVVGTVPDVAHFYPRSPCGEPQVFQRIAKPFRISIHALLAESGKSAQNSGVLLRI